MPEDLIQTVLNNALHWRGYRVVLHFDAATVSGRQKLEAQFARHTGVELVDLRRERHFIELMDSPLGEFYDYFVSEQGRNYGAASDIVRVNLIHEQGGIYMDVDDCLEEPLQTPGQSLLSGRDDLLLHNMVSVELYGFHGYNNSCFAAHAGNRVLAEMLREMTRRLRTERELFANPRPMRRPTPPTQAEAAVMHAYILAIFRLTGPNLLNDVVRSLRPDYYTIECTLLNAYRKTTVSPTEPCILFEEYFQRMHAVKAFYLPFTQPPFAVKAGSAHSWNPVTNG